MINVTTPDSVRPAIRAKHRFGYRGNMFMLWLGRRIPPVGYLGVAIVSFGFWLTNRPARQASMDFWTRVAGIRNRLALYFLSYRQMRTFGILILDRSITLSRPNSGIEVESDHRDRLLSALAMDRGLLILTAHFGALEIAAPWLKTYIHPNKMNFVMYRDLNDTTEQFHRDQWKMLQGMGFINSMDPIAAGLQIMAALRQRQCVGMRADRMMGGRTIHVSLLGSPAWLPAGPFTAAVAGDAVVVTAFTLRQSSRKYRMFVSPPRRYDTHGGQSHEALIQQAATDYAADLENLLLQYPDQWGNFYNFWAAPGDIPNNSNSNVETAASPTNSSAAATPPGSR